MKRCKSCQTRTGSETGLCPVCGIDPNKARKELAPLELRVRRAARHIRLVAMLQLIAAGLGIMALPETTNPLAVGALSILSLILAIGLIQYAFWAYKAAVVCYFAIGMLNIIAVNLLALPVILLLLYVVGNRTAKAIFERQLPTSP